MEAAGFFETLITFYQTTWRHSLEDSSLHIHRRGNLRHQYSVHLEAMNRIPRARYTPRITYPVSV
jgi:hypothetical protein